MERTPDYDEHQELRSPWEWVILIAFSASIMGFGWLVYLLVQDAPRRWDFGQLPDAPAESIYSSEQPRRKAQRQIRPLPEAVPLPPRGQSGKREGDR
ncbi:hypothetical protein KOM00_01790 [Geomonas sp. Red69]|uniref:Cbb3-type cytochrome c oxidase subunit 3 n=1 Tax=Geomonas diazotrophica TaxID=2843197 RepID=A0ABX8JGG6_9BACT|nr:MULTISPECIES: hypothetical protein [Geomonas]MBU5635462.1 hypothetical protein [Geomonas diazotrophica]QWV97489.1 hypothetical protein KP005_19475 [Geomonas nitrogeniifigens]QXE86628.1 hypothetical protein KP003_20130 [Geomonas nitrogeniifigens]